MRWRKSIILPVLAADLLLMTGCTKEEETYQEQIVIDVYDQTSDYQGLQTGWYAKILEDRFNIQLNFLDTEAEGSLEQADLFVCNSLQTSPDSLMEGDRLLNIAPYFEEELTLGEEILDYVDSFQVWNESWGEEEIYVIPSQVSRLSEDTPSEENTPRYGIYLDWEAYEQAGMPEIEDLDELLTVMEELKQPGQQGIILCNDKEMDVLDHVSYLMGVQGVERDGFLVYGEDKVTELLEDESGFMESLLWFREAYRRGLLAPYSGRVSYEQLVKYYEHGKAVVSIWPQMEADGYELAPAEKMKVVSHGCNGLGNMETYLAVSSSAEEPLRIVDFVGWLYSTEGIMFSGTDTNLKSAGPQGLTWEVKDGNPELTEYGWQVFGGKSADATGNESTVDGQSVDGQSIDGQAVGGQAVAVPEDWGGGSWQEGTCKLGFQPVVNVEVSPSGFPYNRTLWETVGERTNSADDSWKEYMDAEDQMEYLMDNDNLEVIPGYIDIYQEEPEEIVDKRTACRRVIVDYSWKIIQEEDDLGCQVLLEKLRREVESLGYQDVVEYDRQINDIHQEKLSSFLW